MTDNERIDGSEEAVTFLSQVRQRRGLKPSIIDPPDAEDLDSSYDREKTLDVADDLASSDELWLGEDGTELDPDYVMKLYIAAQAAKASHGNTEAGKDDDESARDGGELVEALGDGMRPERTPTARPGPRGSAELAPQRRHPRKRQRASNQTYGASAMTSEGVRRNGRLATTVEAGPSKRRVPARKVMIALIAGAVLLVASAGVRFGLTSGQNGTAPGTYQSTAASPEVASTNALWANVPAGEVTLDWDNGLDLAIGKTAVPPRHVTSKRRSHKKRPNRPKRNSPTHPKSRGDSALATPQHATQREAVTHDKAATTPTTSPTTPTKSPTTPTRSPTTPTRSPTTPTKSPTTPATRQRISPAATKTEHSSTATRTSSTTACAGAGVLAPTTCGRPSL